LILAPKLYHITLHYSNIRSYITHSGMGNLYKHKLNLVSLTNLVVGGNVP